MFLGGGFELSCAFRVCFVGACVVGSWSWAPAFLVAEMLFCMWFVSVL